MTNNIIPIGQQINAISASMRQRMQGAVAANRSFASNVIASYPLLSIRGKEFTFRLPDGRSTRHEQNGFALPFIDVVLVEGSPLLSKTYYEKGFDPNEFTRPDCWSLDSVKPDTSSPALQAGWTGHPTGPTCAICPQNVFGSKVTDAGKKAKACQDYRRVVVMLPHQIGSDQATPMALRVPQSSLKNLKAHAELLERYGVDVKAAITRLSFTAEAFPQLVFGYVNILTEPQWDWVAQLAQTPLVQGMVYTPDFENAASTPQQETPGHNAGLQPLTPAPVPEAFSKLMGVIEEEADEDGVLPDQVVKVPPAFQQGPSLSQPIQQAPMPNLQAVPSVTLIELPEGRWYNPVTKQYVEAPTPKVEMPAMDPDTLDLPEGKFFNTRLKAYVTGPEIGAPAALPDPAPKKRAQRTKAAQAPVQAAALAETAQPEPKQAAKPNGNGGIKPASAALDEVLAQALQENPES